MLRILPSAAAQHSSICSIGSSCSRAYKNFVHVNIRTSTSLGYFKNDNNNGRDHSGCCRPRRRRELEVAATCGGLKSNRWNIYASTGLSVCCATHSHLLLSNLPYLHSTYAGYSDMAGKCSAAFFLIHVSLDNKRIQIQRSWTQPLTLVQRHPRPAAASNTNEKHFTLKVLY